MRGLWCASWTKYLKEGKIFLEISKMIGHSKCYTKPDPEEVAHRLREELLFLWTQVNVFASNPEGAAKLLQPH